MAEVASQETIAKIVGDWFFGNYFFPLDPSRLQNYKVDELFREVMAIPDDMKSSEALSPELRSKILNLSTNLAILSDNHWMNGRKEKAVNAIRQAYVLNQMLPIQKRDIERIDTQLRIAIVEAKMSLANIEAANAKLVEHAHHYQRPGVDHYLLMIYHFSLIVCHLKDGNSVLFYSRCKTLKDLLCRNFHLKLTTEPESVRISQVISMKLVKCPLNVSLYKGMVCLATLFEWLNRRMSHQPDLKINILLKNAQSLAEDCDNLVRDLVSKIVTMMQAECRDEETLVKNSKTSALGSQFGSRRYFIRVQDFENSKKAISTRPSSAKISSVHKRSLSGSTPAQVPNEKSMTVYIPGLPNATEDGKVSGRDENTRDRQTVQDSSVMNYKLSGIGRSIKKKSAKGAPMSHTARTLSLHSMIFEKPTMEMLTQRAKENEHPSESSRPSRPTFLDEYKEYSKRKEFKEGSVSLTARTSQPIVSKLVKKSSKVYKIPKGAVANKFAPVTTYGAYYLGVSTLEKHTHEPLIKDVDQEVIEQNMVIVAHNPKNSRFRVLDSELSPIQAKGNSPNPFSQKFSFRKKSKESFEQIKPEKSESIVPDSNIFRSFGIKNAEALLIKRPLSKTSVIHDVKTAGASLEKIGTSNTIIQNEAEQHHRRHSMRTHAISSRKSMKNAVKADHSHKVEEKSVDQNPTLKRRTTDMILTSREKRISVAENLYMPETGKKSKERRFSVQPVLGSKSIGIQKNQVVSKIEKSSPTEHRDEIKDGSPLHLNSEEDLNEDFFDYSPRNDTILKMKSESKNQDDVKQKQDFKGSYQKGSEIKSEGQDIGSQAGIDKLSEKDELSSSARKTIKHSNQVELDEGHSSYLKPVSNNGQIIPPKISIRLSSGSGKNESHLKPRRKSKQKVETMALAAAGLISTFKDVAERRGSLAVSNPRAVSKPAMWQISHGGRSDKNIYQPINHLVNGDASSDNVGDDEESNRSSVSAYAKKNLKLEKSSSFLPKSKDIQAIDHKTSVLKVEEKQSDSILNEALIESPEDIYSKARRDLFLDGLYKFDKSFNVKEDLLKFVQGFYKLRSQIDMATQNTSRMVFFVLRFYPDAVLIQKPKRGLEFHRSMINYNDDYAKDLQEELKWKPWKRRYSKVEECKTIENCYPKISYRQPFYTFITHKQNSCLSPCKKTSIKLINSRLTEEQPLVMMYDQTSRKGRITVAINKKWANQLYSKKGIGSWLNIAFFLKNYFGSISMDDMNGILLEKKKKAEKVYDNIFTEKNKLILRLFIYLFSRKAVLVRTFLGGYKVRLMDADLSYIREAVNQLNGEKERVRANLKKIATFVPKDRLTEMYFLKLMAHEAQQQQKDPYYTDQSEDEDHDHHAEPLDYFSLPNDFLSKPKTPAPRRRRRRSKRHDVKPQNNFLITPIPEAHDPAQGIGCLPQK